MKGNFSFLVLQGILWPVGRMLDQSNVDLSENSLIRQASSTCIGGLIIVDSSGTTPAVSSKCFRSLHKSVADEVISSDIRCTIGSGKLLFWKESRVYLVEMFTCTLSFFSVH